MRDPPAILLNTASIELWPARLARARSNRDARLLAQARRVLRRKSDGRFLAAELPDRLVPLLPHWDRQPGVNTALRALGRAAAAPARVRELPLEGLHTRLDRLGLDAGEYANRTGLALIAEPDWLAFAGFDRYRRPLWLHAEAARGWHRLQAAALKDNVVLEAVSGYRSHDYQLGIFDRKLARGLSLDQILNVNAAPGYSEHHSGRALDISAPGEPAAEESFEHTHAFAWLRTHAPAYGFVMSYPRDNPHGIVYEPWHWCFRASELDTAQA